MSTAIDTGEPDLPNALVDRFRAACERLNPGGGKIGLAVSGGPDSMAMLLLADAAIPDRFEVATVNHGLRPEAADECALVAAACAVRGIACAVLDVEVGKGNVQSAARIVRYEALARWAQDRGLSAIATAHHADDQAETLLMRLNRGSGVAGLAGIREVGIREVGNLDAAPQLGLIRPLLTMRRSDLAQVIQMAGATAADDPSNRDDRFDRVRIRKALADADWIDPLALSQSASHLADADEALQLLTQIMWDKHVEGADGTYRLRNPEALPRVIALRIIARIIAEIGTEPRGGDVARLLAKLQSGEGGNIGGVLASAADGAKDDDWLFRPEPPRRTS